jgi:spermidine synthase
MRRYQQAITAIFVLSGAAGLTYEIVWSRQLVLIFGNTTQAIAAILTGYFAGMAIGNLIGGRLADRVRSGLRLYAGLELLLVVVVLVTPVLFTAVRGAYGWAYSLLEEDHVLLGATRFALALLALAPATILMGATLPSLTRHLARRAADLGDVFGRLYAANTLGAVLGAMVAGFFFIEILGLTGSLVAGAIGSAIAGLIALRLAVLEERAPARATVTDADSRMPQRAITSERGTSVTGALGAHDVRRLALAVAFVSGLTSLGYQTLWTRLLSSGTGSVSYVFSAILVFFLIGLALGPLIVAVGARRGIPTLPWLGATQLLIAALAAVGTVLIAWRPFDLPVGTSWALVVVPTATAIGLSLPLAARLVLSDDAHVGRDTGTVLASNTTGVVLGTMAIPFLIMPALGSPLSVIALAAVNVILGVAILWLGGGRRLSLRAGLASLVVGGLVVAIAGLGLAADPSVVRIRQEGSLYASAEDEIASVQAGQIAASPQLWVAGTSMTALTVDARLMAVLPTIARPQAQDMLVIAFGMGSSYRTGLILGQQVEGVELVPSVPEMFPWFYDDAAAVLADPMGRLLIADGRNHVELTDRSFDIVVVDPPPPIESAGTGVLYSREFYQAAAGRLRPGGVMMEWIPYGQSLAEFLAHVRTFGSVFPEVTLAFGPGGYGVFMFGSSDPVRFEDAAIRDVLSRPGVTEDLTSAPDSPVDSIDAWADLIPTLVIASGADIDKVVGPGDIITDDRPLTEYFLLRRMANPDAVPMAQDTISGAFGLP